MPGTWRHRQFPGTFDLATPSLPRSFVSATAATATIHLMGSGDPKQLSSTEENSLTKIVVNFALRTRLVQRFQGGLKTAPLTPHRHVDGLIQKNRPGGNVHVEKHAGISSISCISSSLFEFGNKIHVHAAFSVGFWVAAFLLSSALSTCHCRRREPSCKSCLL